MYSISMQQIEAFLTVAERGSLTEAARLLFVTQPAVSKWIQLLEKELDAKLFIRSFRGVELTRQGEFLYKEWKRLLSELCGSIESFHSIDDRIEDVLNIGCLSGFNYDHFLPDLIRSYERTYPNVQVRVSFFGFKDLRESLLNGSTDLIFSVTFDSENLQGVSQRIIDELRLYIAISTSHPLA